MVAGDAFIFDDHEHVVLDPDQTKSLIAVMDRTGIATMVLLDSLDVTVMKRVLYEILSKRKVAGRERRG